MNRKDDKKGRKKTEKKRMAKNIFNVRKPR
jgi:hypothetical protein